MIGLFIPDPGSGSWLFTHPGSRILGSKRHRIPDPQHCLKPGSGMEKIQIQDRDPGWISMTLFLRTYKQVLGLRILKFFDEDSDPRSFQTWIREKSDPGSWIQDKQPGSATLGGPYLSVDLYLHSLQRITILFCSKFESANLPGKKVPDGLWTCSSLCPAFVKNSFTFHPWGKIKE